MLERCTYMTAVSLRKTPTAQLEACKRIIDQSDMALAVHDPASARRCGQGGRICAAAGETAAADPPGHNGIWNCLR